MLARIIILGTANIILMSALAVIMVLGMKHFKKQIELDKALYKEYERGFNDAVEELNDKLFEFYKDGFMKGYEDGCNGEKYWFDKAV